MPKFKKAFRTTQDYPSSFTYPYQDPGGGGAGYSYCRAKGGIHSGQISYLTQSDRQPFILTTMGTNLTLTQPHKLYMFGLWEEADVPRKNPRKHGEDMEIPRGRRPLFFKKSKKV